MQTQMQPSISMSVTSTVCSIPEKYLERFVFLFTRALRGTPCLENSGVLPGPSRSEPLREPAVATGAADEQRANVQKLC